MNERQKTAINRFKQELNSEISPKRFLAYLLINDMLNDSEVTSLETVEPAEAVLPATYQLLKTKECGWEGLCDYLQRNNYVSQHGGQWVEDFMRLGNPIGNTNDKSERLADPQENNTGAESQTETSTRPSITERQKSALDAEMSELEKALVGMLEKFVKHLQGKKIISRGDWHYVERSYKLDESHVYHLFNDVLKYRDGSWEEIIVFLYDNNSSTLAEKLQRAAGETTAHPRPPLKQH